MHYCHLDTPIGQLLLAGDAEGLCRITLPHDGRPAAPEADWIEDRATFAEAIDQLGEYFAGTRRSFSVRLAVRGTPFQQRVWRALCDIPYGETISYATLATRIGQPAATRAVGLANGANPLPIIVPCHRVIGANGTLTGYGGGLPTKRQLLDLEQAGARLW